MECKSKRKVCVALVLIILLCNCIILLIFANKSNMHVDEVWSYGLSNSYKKPFLYDWCIGTGEIGSELRNYKLEEGEEDPFISDKNNSFYEQWHTGKEFNDYLTVQEGQRFDYANVYYNQTCDVHPPLYYFLLHTVCSFFPDSFSIWYGACINLFFYTLSLIALFFLGRQVFNSDKKALLAVAVWGLSRAGLSTVAFLRMYLMMSFFTILLAYLHMRLVKDYKLKYVALIFAVNVAGFLTQYYFYIFSFFITASVCFYLLFKKQIKRLLIYAFTVLASVGAAILVFPATIVHLTQGAYTKDTVDGLLGSLFGRNILLTYFLQDYTGLAYYGKTVFADLLPIILVLAILAYWIWICKKKINIKEKIRSVVDKLNPAYTILLVSLMLSGIMIERIAPDMPYYNDRYFFGILPLFALPFVSIICFAAKKAAIRFKKEKYAFKAAAAVLAIFMVLSNTLNDNRYFGKTRSTEELNSIITDAADGGTFYYVANVEYMIHAFSIMFNNADKVYAAHELDDSLAKRINENEVNVKTAYVLFEATNIVERNGKDTADRTSIDILMKYYIKRDYEFISDFYYANSTDGDVYHLYKVNY